MMAPTARVIDFGQEIDFGIIIYERGADLLRYR